jgi:hypothetical protein
MNFRMSQFYEARFFIISNVNLQTYHPSNRNALQNTDYLFTFPLTLHTKIFSFHTIVYYYFPILYQ